MTCVELSTTFGFLANSGKPFSTQNEILSETKTKTSLRSNEGFLWAAVLFRPIPLPKAME